VAYTWLHLAYIRAHVSFSFIGTDMYSWFSCALLAIVIVAIQCTILPNKICFLRPFVCTIGHPMAIVHHVINWLVLFDCMHIRELRASLGSFLAVFLTLMRMRSH
jgi:hypothetical protein